MDVYVLYDTIPYSRVEFVFFRTRTYLKSERAYLREKYRLDDP